MRRGSTHDTMLRVVGGGHNVLNSMTGFGRAEASDGETTVSVEIRTVNHRFRDVSIKAFDLGFASHDRMKRAIEKKIERGRVDLIVKIEGFRDKDRKVRLDRSILSSVTDALSEIESTLGQSLSASDRIKIIWSTPDLLVVDDDKLDEDVIWPLLDQALEEALDQVGEMRRTEGENLQKDLALRIDHIKALMESIAERAPDVTAAYKERLLQKVQEWEERLPVSPESVAAEIALFAERSDIQEELTRLKSHLDQLRGACDEQGAVGRRIDFLLQEIFREMNTIASKAQDVEIVAAVVTAKAEVEKLREQAQNIE